MNFEVTATPDDAITKLAEATGNSSFRVSAPLSGWVRDSRFRVTFPPGFSYPSQPIVAGEISASETGSRIKYRFVSPVLSYLALGTCVVLIISMAWPNKEEIGLGMAALVVIAALCFALRERDKKALLEKLRNIVQ